MAPEPTSIRRPISNSPSEELLSKPASHEAGFFILSSLTLLALRGSVGIRSASCTSRPARKCIVIAPRRGLIDVRMKRTAWILRLIATGLIVAASPYVNAALRRENTTIERTMPAGADAVEIQFSFTNPESHPVTIVHLQPSCGCTTAMMKKYTFAPGRTRRTHGAVQRSGP